MDEADLLGDRIAIMGDGKLKCCGSSIFLKKAYGVGYNITLEKSSVNEFHLESVTSLMKKHVSDYKLLSDAGKEISFQLPFSSSSSFAGLFSDIESNLDNLRLRSYGISVTTLEEVFIRVSKLGADSKALSAMKQSVSNVEDLEKGKPASYSPVAFDKLAENENIRFFICHMHALFNKRFYYFMRDKKTWLFQYIMPVVFVLVGMLVMVNNTVKPNQPFKALRPQSYNSGISTDPLPFPYSNASKFCPGSWDNCLGLVHGQGKIMQNACPYGQGNTDSCPLLAVNDAEYVYNMSLYLYEHRNDYKSTFFGAVSFPNDPSFPISSITNVEYLEKLTYYIHANYSAPHSSHIFSTMVVDSVLKTYNSSASLLINMHTMPNTYREADLFASFNVDLVSFTSLLILLLFFSSYIT
jgi:hypothetical protein